MSSSPPKKDYAFSFVPTLRKALEIEAKAWTIISVPQKFCCSVELLGSKPYFFLLLPQVLGPHGVEAGLDKIPINWRCPPIPTRSVQSATKQKVGRAKSNNECFQQQHLGTSGKTFHASSSVDMTFSKRCVQLDPLLQLASASECTIHTGHFFLACSPQAKYQSR